MRRRAAIVAAVLAATTLVAPGGRAGGNGLTWDGKWLRDAAGRAVILHGVNAVYKTPAYLPEGTGTSLTPGSLNSADADLIASLGFNVVRLGLIWKAIQPAGPGRFDQTYIDRAKSIVDILGAHGIHTLLDFHQDVYNERYAGEGAPDWATQSPLPPTSTGNWGANYFTPAVMNEFDMFWANAGGVQDQYAASWVKVAETFEGDADVLGYDLFNEPFPGSQVATCAGPAGCPVFDKVFLQPFYEKVISVIRAADPGHLVYWEPALTSDFGARTNVGPVGNSQTGISFHDYCLAGSLDGSFSDRNQSCGYTEDFVMENMTAKGASDGAHLLLTEFGANDEADSLAKMADRADGARIGWTYWQYKFYGDPTGAPGEGLIDETGGPKPKAATLARPFPRAIAGDPGSWRWDGASRTFTLSYAADPSLGETEISAPEVIFPSGYVVSIEGAAHVTSAQGSPVVKVAAGIAGPVTVTVMPA